MDAGFSLPRAYGDAKALVDGFSLSGLPPVEPVGSTPSFGIAPSQPPPPPPWAEELDRAIDARERRVRRLRGRREVFRVALEKVVAHSDDWMIDVEAWAQESQAALVDLALACASFLVAMPGHVRADPEAFRTFSNGLAAAAAGIRSGIARVRGLLSSLKASSPEAKAAIGALQEVLDELESRLDRASESGELLDTLEETGKKLVDAARTIELVADIREKHDLLLVQQTLQNHLIDVLKDRAVAAGTTMLREGPRNVGPSVRAARGVAALDFAIDFSYNSLRFYVAWKNEHDILGHIDDAVALEAVFRRKIIETTDELSAARAEFDQLKAARESGDGAEHLLDDLHRQERRDAYLQGEWFSQNTGFVAPGRPLLESDAR